MLNKTLILVRYDSPNNKKLILEVCMRELFDKEFGLVSGGNGCQYHCLCSNSQQISLSWYTVKFSADGIKQAADMCWKHCKGYYQVEYFGNNKQSCCLFVDCSTAYVDENGRSVYVPCSYHVCSEEYIN